ncbi:hypothetical protein DSO57_1008164 [Entomophthora muscae]|uniref:Uncharacterized protein n=1 Tax=Entomophthora muscae TaxID=34485 RepID=A0ACC2T785_9FUNG|nr:hypothetical protein DSO57_1008164 [Entomophthora muscae]
MEPTVTLKAFYYFGDFGKQSQGDIETLRNTLPMTDQFFYKAKAGFIFKSLSTKTIDKLRDILAKPQWDFSVMIELWGGVISGKKGTLFANCDKYASVQIGLGNPNQGKLLEKACSALKGSFDGAFQNYIYANEPDFMKLYYPGIEDQLINVKTKYNQKDKFNFKFSIPTNNQSKKTRSSPK